MMNETKNIESWLSMIAESDVRKAAIKYHRRCDWAYTEADAPHEALEFAFSWPNTNEGSRFWRDIYKKLRDEPEKILKFNKYEEEKRELTI